MICDSTRSRYLYLSGGGLSSEEGVVHGAVGGAELGLQEDAAIGYGLQRGGAFVWEAHSNEELVFETRKKTRVVRLKKTKWR